MTLLTGVSDALVIIILVASSFSFEFALLLMQFTPLLTFSPDPLLALINLIVLCARVVVECVRRFSLSYFRSIFFFLVPLFFTPICGLHPLPAA